MRRGLARDRSCRPRRPRRAGFTLLELVVVVAVLAVLAGAAVPAARRIVDAAARRATTAELRVLADASLEHFRDTGELPRSASDLLRDPGLAGWTGPYVAVSGPDARSGLDGAEVDGWHRPYVFERRGASRLVIASTGIDGRRDGAPGAGDLEAHVDATPVRRAVTLERLRAVHGAIERYHAAGGRPLPGDAGRALGRLVAAGFLPAVEPFRRDGWGEELVCDPPGAAPAVRLTSRRLAR